MEATGGFERALARHLYLSGLAVIVANPRQARDFAKAMGHLTKTDSVDARVLSHFARTLHGSARCEQLLLRLPSVEQQELAALVARRAQVVQARTAERNRLPLAHRLQTKSKKLPAGEIRVRAARPAGSIENFFHALDGKVKLKKPLSIEEMNGIAAAGWAGEFWKL